MRGIEPWKLHRPGKLQTLIRPNRQKQAGNRRVAGAIRRHRNELRLTAQEHGIRKRGTGVQIERRQRLVRLRGHVCRSNARPQAAGRHIERRKQKRRGTCQPIWNLRYAHLRHAVA